MRVFWTLLEMARAAGAWPPDDPLEGIETDIELAHKVNTYVEPPGKSSESPRPGRDIFQAMKANARPPIYTYHHGCRY